MIELLDLTIWTVRLNSQCELFGERFFKTIPDDELTIELHDSPVGFVYLSEDNSDENPMKNDSTLMQKMNNQVAVEIIIRRSTDHAQRFNESAVDAIRSYRTEVFNALVGWRPAGSIKKVQHISGKLKSKEPKQIKWVDLFSADIIITN
jgi:hypothetical protein